MYGLVLYHFHGFMVILNCNMSSIYVSVDFFKSITD